MSNNYLQLVDRRQKRTFTQPHTVSRHLFCSICSDVFDDPVRTICGYISIYSGTHSAIFVSRTGSVSKPNVLSATIYKLKSVNCRKIY